jgi:N-methylhydantoinase A
MTPENILRIGIDIGGTFTDFVVFRPSTGRIDAFKLLSTPHDPAEAVLVGLARIRSAFENLDDIPSTHIIHGSTVATNALLERKGARSALVSTRGFADLLQIGRQNRPQLYDFSADPPPALIPHELRFEVDERVASSGEVLQALDPAQVESLIPELRLSKVESVAVCLLFSFLHPEHEAAIAARLRRAGFLVSCSSEVLPEYREYERASTTAVNAYVSPVLDSYLSNLEAGLPAGTPLSIMQSNGGVIDIEEARRNGVRCILSGPAGGVVGAQYVGTLSIANPPPSVSGIETQSTTNDDASSTAPQIRLITFDMGGTSTDVSLIDGAPQITTESLVGGCPIRIPILDIHTIGAGGGSIAILDPGGALRVGPQSAGADPGPACYGRGDLPTVTDANLVLGRLSAEHFLGGEMPLDVERSQHALARLGAGMGLNPHQAALGVIEVANAHMERALRVISVERGHDPRRFTLLSFGGAGGLHAVDLARQLGIGRVLVPPLASTLSAFGMLAADVVKDYTQTVMLAGDTPSPEIAARLAPLAERGLQEVLAEGIPQSNVHLERLLDVRYRGQSYELTLPFSADVPTDFHALHRKTYGYDRREAPLDIVNLRLRAIGQVEPPSLVAAPFGGSDPTPALLEHRQVIFSCGALRLPLYRGEHLRPGNQLPGPALVVRADTTILIGPSDHAHVDPYGNLLIVIGAS